VHADVSDGQKLGYVSVRSHTLLIHKDCCCRSTASLFTLGKVTLSSSLQEGHVLAIVLVSHGSVA